MKIISGGQTGADRAGLDAAIAMGFDYGGAVPKGRRAEDGHISYKYSNLEELLSELNNRGKEGWKIVACLEGMVILLMREK